MGAAMPDTVSGLEEPVAVAPRRRFATDDGSGTGITVVRGFDELMKVVAIRSAVFIGEREGFTYKAQFDGNDFCATHLLYSIDGEPAGCMRIRFFGEFAKMERLAVRKEFRRSRIAFELVRASVDLCRAKGYRKLYGHGREEILSFWKRFGFQVKGNGAPLKLGGIECLEFVHDIEPFEDCVSLDGDPLLTIRAEGLWDVPGVFELEGDA